MHINFSDDSFQPIDRSYNYSQGDKSFNALTLGACSYVGNLIIDCCDYDRYLPQVLIGRFCSLAGNIVFFMGYNHEYKNVVTPFPFDSTDVMDKICKAANFNIKNYLPHEKRYDNHYQVIVGNDVWIGRGATIIGDVKIGDGVIVGTNSMVTKDVPPYAIVAGNPARVLKYRFDADTIKKFMAIKWWNWHINKVLENAPLMYDTEKFLAKHYTPALNVIPYEKNGGGRQIEEFRAEGRNIYTFVADFRAHKPLWKRIISGFCASGLSNAVMIIFTGANATGTDINELTNLITKAKIHSEQSINIILSSNEKIFSPYLIRQATHFITTREMINLECLDYLYDTDVKIISALDDAIFDGEPEVVCN